MGFSYKEAGVDIEKGDRFASFIGSIRSKAVSSSIGGFAGGLPVDLTKYKKPLLFSCTDGVGTKLMVAMRLKKYDTVGIDLVAMSVNDLIVCGIEPISFLDYIACGRLNESVLKDVIKGVVDGCEQAECVLTGGETAEMPDLYRNDDFDLAGFCVGIGDEAAVLPFKEKMGAGDLLFALPSSGVHSNGLSLARKALSGENDAVWEKLLTPTKIYVKEMKALLATGCLLGAAHITGGGLEGNTVRVLPPHLKPQFTWDWPVPEIFHLIQEKGGIETAEMRKVFNMGLGIVIVVKAADADAVLKKAAAEKIELIKVGELVNG